MTDVFLMSPDLPDSIESAQSVLYGCRDFSLFCNAAGHKDGYLRLA